MSSTLSHDTNALAGGYAQAQAGAQADSEGAPRTYQVRTYGCQMNVHDSERLKGLLEEAGYTPAAEDIAADVVVFNLSLIHI